MDTFARYIFTHRDDLLEQPERDAHRAITWQQKLGENAPRYPERIQRLGVATREAEVLLQHGVEAFYAKAVARVLAATPRHLVFNLCPRCGGLARTPRAKQCPHCLHDWH